MLSARSAAIRPMARTTARITERSDRRHATIGFSLFEICDSITEKSLALRVGVLCRSTKVLGIGTHGVEDTVLHRDVFWLGRQWAVTGYGIQAVSKKFKMRFDIEASRVW